MNLLITPAIRFSSEQKKILSESNKLFYIETELAPIHTLDIDFSLNEIEGIICNYFFTVNSLDVLPNLKFIQLASAGLERVPLNEIAKKGIALFNAGHTYSVPIAEWVMGRILSVYKKSNYFFEMQQKHSWSKNRTLRELSDSSATIIGFGSIGTNVAKRLKAFDVSINAVDIITPKNNVFFDKFYDISQLKTAVRDADIIIICTPLTEDTYHMINNDILLCMKDDATLVNTSRGALIDETELIEHIKTHPLFNAALDVFEKEPLDSTSFFWNSNQVMVSPHNAFESTENSDRLFQLIRKNLQSVN